MKTPYNKTHYYLENRVRDIAKEFDRLGLGFRVQYEIPDSAGNPAITLLGIPEEPLAPKERRFRFWKLEIRWKGR